MKYILVFILLLACSCSILTPNSPSRPNWVKPQPPVNFPVEFKEENGRIYLEAEDARNLMKNINELDSHIKKWEALFEEITKYYEEK
jgi:hypothetical protein